MDAHGLPTQVTRGEPDRQRAVQPSMPPTIRLLHPEDAEAVAALRREMLLDTPTAFLASPESDSGSDVETVRERLGSGAGNSIVGALAPDLVGSVGVLHAPRHPKGAHHAHIWGMYVQPGHRGRGFGKLLLEAAIAHARTLTGVTQLNLGVSASTPGARALYESVGFVVWGTEPRAMRVDGEYHDEVFMALNLDD